LFGVPPDSRFLDPAVLAGRWLQPGDTDAIVLGSDVLRHEPGIAVGDTIRVSVGPVEHGWEVVGIVQLGMTANAYTGIDTLNDVLGTSGQSSVLVAETTDQSAEGQQAAADNLEDIFKTSGIGVNATTTQQTLVGIMLGVVNFVIAFLMAMALLLAVVGALSLTGTLSLNVIERQREIAVMRALGASDGIVRRIVWLESMVIGALSWFFACLVSVPLSAGFSAVVGVAFFNRPMVLALSGAGYFLWPGIVILIGTLASLIPAQQVIRSRVRDVVSYR
jgi:putative ABC transport system permease protein